MKRFFTLFLCIFLSVFTFLFSGCTKTPDYYSYVSEHRKNLLLCSLDDYKLKIYATEKEYPYHADGVKRPTSTVAEFFFYAPSGENSYLLSFYYDGKPYGGEFSYDSVKRHYYFSCPTDLSTAKSLAVEISCGEEKLSLNAATVLLETTLSGKAVLERVVLKENALFSSLTEKREFLGEIFLRVLHEENVYYYVGVATKEGKIYAFLVDGESGEIIAKRQN